MNRLVSESLDSFVRNQDPVKSLGLGYEGKIRNFFRGFNIPDKDYEVKEDGEIAFNISLDLENTQISELPDNLTINGYLNLENTQIRELPDNLTVKDNIYVNKYQTELIDFIQNSKFKNKLIIE